MTRRPVHELLDAVGVRLAPDLPGVYMLFQGTKDVADGGKRSIDPL